MLPDTRTCRSRSKSEAGERRSMLAPVAARRLVFHGMEYTGEVRLRAITDFLRDLRDGPVRRREQQLRLVEAPARDERVRRHSRRAPEHAREVEGAQVHRLGNLLDRECRRVPLLDESQRTPKAR